MIVRLFFVYSLFAAYPVFISGKENEYLHLNAVIFYIKISIINVWRRLYGIYAERPPDPV